MLKPILFGAILATVYAWPAATERAGKFEHYGPNHIVTREK